MPTLSVIMPNYNHARYVATAIRSVIDQSRRPDELIILDDGSVDESPQVIEEMTKGHPWIRVERNPRNMGMLWTVQRLMKLVRGDYLIPVASDDYFLPGFFEKAMEMAAQYPDAGEISGNVIGVDAEGREWVEQRAAQWTEPLYAPPERFLREYLSNVPPDHSLAAATILRKAALDAVGGYREALGYWWDTFAVRAVALRYGACYLPMRCAAFRGRSDSFSGVARRDMKCSLDIVDRMAWLMRSPEFSADFPEEYTGHWHREIRRLLIEEHVSRLLAPTEAYHAAYYSGILHRSLLNRVFGSFFSRTLTLHRKIAALGLRLSLARYRGDLTPLLAAANARNGDGRTSPDRAGVAEMVRS